MNWSDQAWAQITDVYARIIHMPFIRELQSGTLSSVRFRFYISQDARYLEHFSKALAMIGARHAETGAALAFYRFAETAIIVERVLHDSYFRDFGIEGPVPMGPACHHYSHFLLSQAAMQPVEVAMASVLPCFWIYREVGLHIHAHATVAENPYQRWIDTYVNPDFDASVREAIRLCDAAAEGATPAVRNAMTSAFKEAARLEYDFWEGAYRQRSWED